VFADAPEVIFQFDWTGELDEDAPLLPPVGWPKDASWPMHSCGNTAIKG
jgi:hypothetical protein